MVESGRGCLVACSHPSTIEAPVEKRIDYAKGDVSSPSPAQGAGRRPGPGRVSDGGLALWAPSHASTLCALTEERFMRIPSLRHPARRA